jgi:beta-phosphoglucomutase family hydrolase
MPDHPVIDPAALDAVIFDMDGVITKTAKVHFAAWKELFDGYLRKAAAAAGDGSSAADPRFRPFTQEDYLQYVDGKPRYDGVRDLLASRGIDLPLGDPADDPGTETVCGLGNRKNDLFTHVVRTKGVEVYPSTVTFIEELQATGIRAGVVSASNNTTEVLEAAGVHRLFEAQVDGLVATQLGLPGKPDPAPFLEAARRLGVPPERAAVVEDAQAGVQAGHAGRFGLVIGVDRTGQEAALRAHGADVVVDDLSEVTVAARP